MRPSLLSARRLLAASLALTSFPLMLTAQPADDIAALREQIRLLDQKLRVLERKTEIKDEETAAATRAAARVTVNDRGFTLASGDGAHTLRLRGLIQGDSRWFVDDGGIANNDAFVIRRARLIFEGTFNRFVSYQLVPEFGGTSGNGSLSLLDANIGVAFSPTLQLRVGRFREPVGLEQLQSDAVAFFAERSVVSQFVPNRDLGVQFSGDLRNGTVSYAIGVFNGVADGSNNANNSDINDEKDVAARLFFQPFRNEADSALKGLGFGLAGSLGEQNGTAGALTGGYRTDGQQTFFAYRSTTVANGSTWRFSPQAHFYRGPFGLLGEYVVSSVEAANGAVRHTLKHKAWQAAAGYVLTGEDAGYAGVSPRQSFDPAAGTWGAFEVVGRVTGAEFDDNAFAGGAGSLANSATSASSSVAYGLGLNWYLTRALRASFNYFHTEFDAAPGIVPATTTVIGNDENAFVTRLQLNF